MPPASQNDFKFEPRLEREEEWIARFTDAMDSLDWVRWGPYWCTSRLYALQIVVLVLICWVVVDAFLQFGNAPKQVGSEVIGKFIAGQTKFVESMTHR